MKKLATLVAALALALGSGCGPKGAHTTDSYGPYNLLVHNYANDSVDVSIKGETIGTVDAHRTGYYWVKPGTAVADADLSSSANGSKSFRLLPSPVFGMQGFVELDYIPGPPDSTPPEDDSTTVTIGGDDSTDGSN
jgi:hypothetical protein